MDYTDWHFASEEKVFREFGYPETEKHVEEHKSLLKTARNLQADLEKDQSVLTTEVLDFLQDWVTNHILGNRPILQRVPGRQS